MSEPWRVLSQHLDGRWIYIAGRPIDPDQPLHGGNVEHSGTYLEDRDEVARRVAALNGDMAAYLKTVPTSDLVAELASREGVSSHVANIGDWYQVEIHPNTGRTYDSLFEEGPATILVVVD